MASSILLQGGGNIWKQKREAILEAYGERKDTQSKQIRVRMGGVLTDLHAADVRYHIHFKAISCLPNSVVKYLAESRGSIHNSIDIQYTPCI